MPTEATNPKDEPETEGPVAPVITEPSDLKEEHKAEKPVAPVTEKTTDLRAAAGSRSPSFL